jgi:hypothetical protein
MERVPVESSNVAAVGYNPESRVLEVEFKGRNGKTPAIYQYLGVSHEQWVGLLRAPSKGQYLSREIKPDHEAHRIQ